MNFESTTKHLKYNELLDILEYLDIDAIPDETYKRVIDIKNFLKNSSGNQLVISGE